MTPRTQGELVKDLRIAQMAAVGAQDRVAARMLTSRLQAPRELLETLIEMTNDQTGRENLSKVIRASSAHVRFAEY
jgi:hypothetical protein